MRRGPGSTPFPRFGVLRVSDLVAPTVDVVRIRAALAARGVSEGDRDTPVGDGVRAVLSATAAGTVVTLERRSTPLTPRSATLRRLTVTWDLLAGDLSDAARSPDTTA